MWDALNDPTATCVIERDDGFVDVDPTRNYMSSFDKWSPHERQALSLARGRVLDVGCGLGRIALYLQDKGLKVVGIDNSPKAVAACRRRGVKDVRVVPIEQSSKKLLGVFDTIVMFGNNFDLMGGFERGRMLLRRFGAMTTLPGRIIAQTSDPHRRFGRVRNARRDKRHLDYRRANVRKGRMAGQIRFRIRYLELCTPYLDYLFVSKKEMREMIDGTGWRIARFFDSDGPNYIAVLEKECVT